MKIYTCGLSVLFDDREDYVTEYVPRMNKAAHDAVENAMFGLVHVARHVNK